MCDKTETALEILKPKIPEEIALVFEQQVADLKRQGEKIEKQGDNIVKLEKSVSELSEKVSGMDIKLDKITQYIERPSWIVRFWEKYGDKITIIALIVVGCSVLGLSMSELVEVWNGLK